MSNEYYFCKNYKYFKNIKYLLFKYDQIKLFKHLLK